jgi:hypothetical protein
MPGLCRDCFADAGELAPRCTACGSPRMIRHPELGSGPNVLEAWEVNEARSAA